MLDSETAKVLTLLAIVDHRQIGLETVAQWHELIGHLDFDVAREAVGDAQRNTTIQYIEPRHILAHAEAVKQRRDRRARIEGPAKPSSPGAPRPDNMAAMEAAWNDPVEFARQKHIYHQQLREAGYHDQWME